ncbi:hypothetical protein GCM10027425_32970 [Alteromonas gracilis]
MSRYFAADPPRGVVVGDDGSRNAHAAVAYAAEEAQRRGVDLHVISAFSIATAPRPEGVAFGQVPSVAELGAEVERLLVERWADLPVRPRVHAVHGPAVRVMVEAAGTADVVVVGARGKGGVEGLLLGSVADQVLQAAPCPVVRVPGPAAD